MNVGDETRHVPAPEFDLEGLDGERVRSSDYRGSKILVALLRNARCAVCNLWVHETAARAERWRARGLAVIAVFEAPADKLRSQFDARRPPFAIAADPDGRIHELYGSANDPERIRAIVESGAAEPALRRAAEAGFPAVQEEGANFYRIPCEALIDERGLLAVFHRAEAVTDHLEPEVVEQFIDGGEP